MAKAAKAEKPNLFVRFTNYLRDVWRELGRVVWPTRSEVINSSVVVIATLLFFIFFTLIIDTASIYVVRFIAGIGG